MLRLSADELAEGGNTLEDTLKYLEYVQAEVDIFDVSCGLKIGRASCRERVSSPV